MPQKTLESGQREANTIRFMLEDELRKLRGQLEVQSKQLQEFQNQKAASLGTIIKEILDASLDELVRMKTTLKEDEESQINFRKEISLQYRVQSRHIEHLQSEELAQVLFEHRKRLSQKLELEVTEDDIQQWGMEEGQEPEDDEENVSPPPGLALEHGFDTPVSAQLSENASSPTSPRQMILSSVEPLDQPIDLTDEEFWDNISDKEMSVRFAEFRQEALRQIDELRTAVSQASPNEELMQKQRDDKRKWKEERSTLLDHIQQLQKLQDEAESDANEAMKQLEEVAAQLDEVQRSKAEGIDDAARHSLIDENLNETRDNVSSREQGTSPDLPVNPSKKSVVHLVEEKRAAMMKRKENTHALYTSTSKTSSAEDSAKFFQLYKSVLEFKKHIADLLSSHPSSQQKLLHVQDPDITETESMLHGMESTLASVELAIKTLLGSLNDNTAPTITFHSPSNDGNEVDDLRNSIAELQSEMQSMRLEYDRRAQQDSEIIQQLHHSLANGKQDNIPNNMKITTNTPSAPAPISADHLLTLNRGHRTHAADPSVTMMFTRLDSQHNTKTLLNSTKTGRINQETLDSLVLTMEGYNEIASTRLQQLVQKIVHHTKMKEIEVNVRNSNLVTSEVFEILEKMEDLQRRRAQHWSRQMDELSTKRRKLGLLLQDAMQRLEKITGVFLIKPILSYDGKSKSRKYSGKISTKFNKYQVEAMAAKELSRRLEYGDIAARMNSPRYNPLPSRDVPWTAQSMPMTAKQTERDGLTISGLTRVNPPSMWNLGASLPQSVPITKNEKWSSSNLVMPSSVPRLVELDAGRFLHEINPVHTLTATQGNSPRGIPGPSRLYNGVPRSRGNFPKAAISKVNSGRRSKVIIRSPTVETVKSESSAEDYQSTAPPTTPASQIQLRRGSTTTPPGSDRGSLETPNLPRPLPPIQVPSRSQGSTRSSLTNSPLKDFRSPSPVKSPNTGRTSPTARDKSNLSLLEDDVEESNALP